MLPQAPDWLIRRFAPRVVIDVAPEAFTFSRNGASRCLATYLYVMQREGLREIVAIGQDAPGSLGVVRIDLFAAGQSTVSDLNEHLEAYLTYGLQSLHTWSLIRPFVTVRGANRLAAFLSGYEQGLLRDALGRAAEILIVEDASRRISGDIPFGVIGVPAAISAVADGRDLKLLATLDAARVTGHLVARGDIKTPDALRGKRLGVNRIGTGAWIHSILALDHLGLDPKRDGISFVEFGSVPQLVQALEAGAIDAVVVDPGQSTQLRSKGFTLLLDMYPANISGVQSALVVAGAYSRQHPDVVEKVVAGLVEGIAFSLAPQNEETVRKTLMARMKIPAPAATESGYRNFLSRANRKPYASIAAMQNM